MTTINDLARECKVSIATVSRAFTPNSNINQKTRERILKRAKELNYIPNTIARGLKSNQTYSIGIIVPEITNSFYFSVIQNIEFKYREKGYRVVLGFYQKGVSCEAEIIENMASYRVDALIFSPVDRSSEAVLKRCFPKGNVLQLFNRCYDEYSGLMINDIKGTADATEYLISKGHKRIMYYGEQSRSVGYLESMGAHGLDFSELYYPSYALDAFNAAECIKKSNPTAILAIAKWSENVVSALHRMNLNVPGDISLIVYDEVEWTRMLDITTVSHPFDSISSMSIEIILDDLVNECQHKPSCRLIDTFIVERKSVRTLEI